MNRRLLWSSGALLALCVLAGRTAFAAGEVKLRICGKTVAAEVVSVSDKTVTLKIGGNEQSFPYGLLDADGVYACKKAKSDPNSAADHFALGQFCLSKKLAEEAKNELAEAKRLKPDEFGPKVDTLLAEANPKPEPVKKPVPPAPAPDAKAVADKTAPKETEEDLAKKYKDLKTGVIESQIDGTTKAPHPEWCPKFPAEVALKYSLYVPEIRDVKEKFPLLVSLHGAGDTNANYMNMWKGHCEKSRWMLLAPKSIGPTFMPACMVRIGQLVQELKDKYPIDPAKVYIHGYSNGGTTALLMASVNPGMFSAAACIHGIPSPEIGNRPEGRALKGLRVFAVGGGQDPCFPLERVKQTCAALEKLGVTVKLHERPEAGHSYPFELNDAIAEFLSGAGASPAVGAPKADEAKKEADKKSAPK